MLWMDSVGPDEPNKLPKDAEVWPVLTQEVQRLRAGAPRLHRLVSNHQQRVAVFLDGLFEYVEVFREVRHPRPALCPMPVDDGFHDCSHLPNVYRIVDTE